MKSTKTILAASVAMLALAGCKHTDSVAGGGGDPGNPGGGGGTLVQGDTLATTDDYKIANAYQDG